MLRRGTSLIKRCLYVSDMHLEVNPNLNYNKLFQQKASCLILAGDIGNPIKEKQAYVNFLTSASKHFHDIFYVLGNHEYYNTNKIPMTEMKDKITNICSKLGNIHILDNDKYELDNVTILGTTLWSLAKEEDAKFCNDYHMIYGHQTDTNITRDYTVSLHNQSVLWLERNITDSNKPCIVISHHAPLVNKQGYYLSHPRYKRTSCFQTDLSHLFDRDNNRNNNRDNNNKNNDSIKVWIHGHTHYSTDFNYYGTRVCSNQVGYEREKLVFDYSKSIDLDQLWIDDI
jgi:predicted phosphohydrolase